MSLALSQQFRHAFPFFHANQSWTYLDSAATALKPQLLADSTAAFYQGMGSVHRSTHDQAQTARFERVRAQVAERFKLGDPKSVIWTSGCTAAINLVANGIAAQIQPNDEIIITEGEHHANFLPWQQLAERRQAKLIVLPLDSQFRLAPDTLAQALSPRTKLVAFHLVSNVTGVRQDAETLIALIRRQSQAQVLLDIAQAVSHEQIDCQTLDADFYAFSAHKMFGPTGLGVLMGKPNRLVTLTPLHFGGKMVERLAPTDSGYEADWAALPYRLEAGTPNIAAVLAFGALLDWLAQWDFAALGRELNTLAEACRARLRTYPQVKLLGESGVNISFYCDAHHSDLSAILEAQQIAIRAGQHCASQLFNVIPHHGALRLSLAFYNNKADLDAFFRALDEAFSLLD